MYDQGSSYNSQSGQGPQGPMPPPPPPPPPAHLQRPLATPPGVPHGFQQGAIFVQPRPGQQGMPIYQQHSTMPVNWPGGMTGAGQNYLQPPPPGHGSAPLPHAYPPGLLGSQHPYYRVPPPLPPVPQGLQHPRGLPPPPPVPQGHLQQQAQQPGGMQTVQHLPPPPPLPSTSSPLAVVSSPSLPVATASNLLSHSETDTDLGNLTEGKAYSPLKSSQVEYSEQPNQYMTPANPSPADDSDMEMEDDITQYENGEALSHTIGDALDEFPSAGNRENSVTRLPVGDKGLSRASVASEYMDSDENSGQVVKGASPFKLIQEYASDESSENIDRSCFKVTSLQTVIHPATDSGSSSLQKNVKGSGLLPNSSKLDSSNELQAVVEETVPLLMGGGSTNEHVGNQESKACVSYATADNLSQEKYASRNAALDMGFSDKNLVASKDKTENVVSESRKTDQFGRLVREGVTDTDSDDSGYTRRRSRGRKSRSRSHSRSCSRSPLDRRWRRRKSPQRRRGKSPQRRRGKRSRSRSCSPRNRRSRSRSPRNWRNRSRSPRSRRTRSRSPSFRRTAEFNTGTKRWGKGQIRDCFDFLQGRCYRGASCRYYHHENERNGGPRSDRNKHRHYSNVTNANEDTKKVFSKASDHKHEPMNHEVECSRDVLVCSVDGIKDRDVADKKEAPMSHVMPYTTAGKGGQLVDSHGIESESEVVTELCDVKTKGDANILKSHAIASRDISTLKDSRARPSKFGMSDPVVEDADQLLQQTDVFSTSDFSSDEKSNTSPVKCAASGTLPSSKDSWHTPPHIPPLLTASFSEAVNAPQGTQQGRSHNLMQQAVPVKSPYAPQGNSSHVLLNQNSVYPVPSDSSSSSLPLPPPLPLWSATNPTGYVGNAESTNSLQFQQSHWPPVNGGSSQMHTMPYSTGFQGQSQVSDFQPSAYTAVQVPHQSLLHVDTFNSKPTLGCSPYSQQTRGPALSREDYVMPLPVQGMSASDSCTEGQNLPTPVPLMHESAAIRVQSFSATILPPAGTLMSSFQAQQHPELVQPIGVLPHPAGGGIYDMSAKISNLLPPDCVDTNQPSHMPEISGPRRATHYNPYASTFEKPMTSRFSAYVFQHEKDALYSGKHDNYSSLSNASLDGQIAGTVRYSQQTSLPKCASSIGQTISRLDSDRYDPLLDGIEPSLNTMKKFDHYQIGEASNNSDNLLRLSGSNKPLDVGENKKKEVSGIAVPTCLDNEEFGETADSEVGDIEDASQSNRHATTDLNVGEVEIDQNKSPGKQKKSKDSRSTRLFKAALADFVKEVLKPSWRQGNMSKEAFKTVVKKTVDKVSGAMKGHRVPKSKAKIDQYIDSSQQKLTRLVMGYVDKYAKG